MFFIFKIGIDKGGCKKRVAFYRDIGYYKQRISLLCGRYRYMKIVTKVMEKIFDILFLMFAIIVLYMIKDRIPSIKGTDTQIAIQTVLIVLLAIVVIWIYVSADDEGDWKCDIAKLFLASLIIRFGVVWLFGIETNQVSDFASAYKIGLSDMPFAHRKGANFPNWAMYPLYIRTVVSLFGEGYLTVVIWNVIWTTISVCLTYNLCRLLEFGRKKAILAALIFCMWPAYLAYTIIMTPEHLNIVLVLMGLNVFAYSYKCEKNIKKQYIMFALSGCILSFSNFFKPVSIIVVIAISIIFFLELPKIMQRENRREIIKKIGVRVLCFLIAYILVGQAGDYIIKKCYGREINPSVSIYYVATGLCLETKGHFWRPFAKAYQDCIGSNGDYASANAMAKDVIKDEIIALSDNMRWVDFFKDKILIVWRADEYMGLVQATINSEGKSLLNVEQWNEHMMAIIYYFYMTVWLLVGTASIICVCKRGQNHRLLFFSRLFVFGMACVLLVSEGQTRYKCVVYPYLAIVAAYGIEEIVAMVNGGIRLIKEKTGKQLERKG